MCKDTIWVNPVGGYGDILMLSGVLYQAWLRNPIRKYSLVRRSRYQYILDGHPAIERVGHPPVGAEVLTNNYWAAEQLGPGNQRAYQILARMFGLSTPIDEQLFFAGSKDSESLNGIISWKKRNILIAPASDSPRKMLTHATWEAVIKKLTDSTTLIVQAGREKDLYVSGALSLLGLTTPGEIIGLLRKIDCVVTTDNFIMHAAHLTGTKTVAIWGPTNCMIYGYKEQRHLQADISVCEMKDNCIGPHCGNNYGTECPYVGQRCINAITTDTIVKTVTETI